MWYESFELVGLKLSQAVMAYWSIMLRNSLWIRASSFLIQIAVSVDVTSNARRVLAYDTVEFRLLRCPNETNSVDVIKFRESFFPADGHIKVAVLSLLPRQTPQTLLLQFSKFRLTQS